MRWNSATKSGHVSCTDASSLETMWWEHALRRQWPFHEDDDDDGRQRLLHCFRKLLSSWKDERERPWKSTQFGFSCLYSKSFGDCPSVSTLCSWQILKLRSVAGALFGKCITFERSTAEGNLRLFLNQQTRKAVVERGNEKTHDELTTKSWRSENSYKQGLLETAQDCSVYLAEKLASQLVLKVDNYFRESVAEAELGQSKKLIFSTKKEAQWCESAKHERPRYIDWFGQMLAQKKFITAENNTRFWVKFSARIFINVKWIHVWWQFWHVKYCFFLILMNLVDRDLTEHQITQILTLSRLHAQLEQTRGIRLFTHTQHVDWSRQGESDCLIKQVIFRLLSSVQCSSAISLKS